MTLSWSIRAPELLVTALSYASHAVHCVYLPNPLFQYPGRQALLLWWICNCIAVKCSQPKSTPVSLRVSLVHHHGWWPRTRRRRQKEEGTKKLPLLLYIPLPNSLPALNSITSSQKQIKNTKPGKCLQILFSVIISWNVLNVILLTFLPFF